MMSMLEQKNKEFLKFLSILTLCLFYNSFYLLLIHSDLKIQGGYLALLGQVSLDALITFYSFNLYRKTQQRYLKLIYLFFCLSAIAAMIADGVYHIAMNIVAQSYFNDLNSFFEIPFILFLFFQVLGWCLLSCIGYKPDDRKAFHYFPYVTVSLFILFTFIGVLPWRIHYLSQLGVYQMIDTILEVIGFSFSAICLARSQNYSIRFMSIGFLFVISSDLLIRYHVISGIIPSLSFFETTWILGLLLMAIGLYLANKNKPIKLLPLNSLHSYVAIWLLNLLLVFTGLSLFMNYFFPDKDISHYLLWIMIPCTFFAIIGSKHFASKILSPLARLESVIKDFISSDADYEILKKRPPIQIEDFNLLEQFIYDTFDIYKKNHHIELEYAKIATQVAHDIRSPLAAINTVLSSLTTITERQRVMIRNATTRINDIANNLLSQSKLVSHSQVSEEIKEDVSSELVFLILENIISEKRLEFYQSSIKINLHIASDAHDGFADVALSCFKRVLSNLINNSVEALGSKGFINVTMNQEESYIRISIEDNGCGIPNALLPIVTAPGFSHNKKNGTGFGLSYAKQYFDKNGGGMDIKSIEGVGTMITFSLPRSSVPAWCCVSISMSPNHTIIVLDDDISLKDIWNVKFKEFNNTSVLYYSNPHEFKKNRNHSPQSAPSGRFAVMSKEITETFH